MDEKTGCVTIVKRRVLNIMLILSAITNCIYVIPVQLLHPTAKGMSPTIQEFWFNGPVRLVILSAMKKRIGNGLNARGILLADFAVRPVWTLRDDGRVVKERLLLRRDGSHITYTLTNAPVDTALSILAQRKSQRYFIERSIQEAKSELGWDEFQAVKCRAWEHHLALTLLASWFIAETRLDWIQDYPRDPALLEQYATEILPALSLANVRELLRASFPLPQLSSQQAALLVVKHLANRTQSRTSRLKRRFKP
jgi:hypothetical protein